MKGKNEKMKIANNWSDYAILDMANGEKLERWGNYILIRPDPQIIWKEKTSPEEWKRANAKYNRSKTGGGSWEYRCLLYTSKLEKINQKNITGVIGIASDLVKYDSIYEKIILNLLGRTVVVENMDVAIALARQNSYSFKIIKLKGDVVNPSGSITGGSVATRTVNILGRKEEINQLAKEIQKQKEKLQTIQTEKEEYVASIENIL